MYVDGYGKSVSCRRKVKGAQRGENDTAALL